MDMTGYEYSQCWKSISSSAPLLRLALAADDAKQSTASICTHLRNEGNDPPMETQDAYKELGLNPSASDAQIKAAWRRLVAAWHPDRNAAAGAGRRMQLINKAYQHIRQLRDGDSNGSNDSGDNRSEAAQSSASEAPEAQTPANTHVRKVRLSMEEAILGCTRTLRGHFTHTCNDCVGKGQRVLAQACGTCRGSGAVRKAALFGWLWNQEACADCGGDGRQREPCEACHCSGERAVPYRRQVRFPAGLREGHVLSVPASRHGDVAIGLELQVEIEPHPFSLWMTTACCVVKCRSTATPGWPIVGWMCLLRTARSSCV